MTKNSENKSKGSKYDELIDVSAQVFAENGFKGSTIQDISRKMGWTSAAIYYYVKSKDDILYEICRRAGARLQNAIDEIVALDVDTEKKINLLFNRHAELIINDRPTFEVLILERSKIPVDEQQLLKKDERKYLKTFASLIDSLSDGDYRVKEPYALALGAISMLNGVIRWYEPGGRLSLEEIASMYCDLFLSGIYKLG